MNLIALDRDATDRLVRLPPRRPRPPITRRIIELAGPARGHRRREPTPLGAATVRQPIEIVDVLPDARWQGLAVATAFIGLFFRLNWLKLTRRGSPQRTASEVRPVFEHLGGLWMKVGQLMSLRRDVLPPELCDELAQLQHRAIGFPSAIAIGTIERELGRSIDDIFETFDPLPFAAASLSQVHSARLRSKGRDVVVKILRPGVRGKFDRDMRVLRFLAKRLDHFPRLRMLRLKDAVTELEQIFFEESDYRYEAANAKELRRVTRDHKITIPKVYEEYSTASVIVMERIFGVLMSDFIRTKQQDPDLVQHWLRANNIHRKRVGTRLLISFMRQLFENNFFHADLHPGNVVLLRDSRIALIDLGSVGSLDREFLTLYRGLQRALADQDYGKAADLQLRLCTQLPSGHLPELRSDLARCLRLWSNKTRIKSLPFQERSINTGAAEVSQILSRYGAQQTWEFLKIARTLSTLDASLQYLHAELDYISILQQHFSSTSKRGLLRAIKPAAIARSLGDMVATVDEYHLLFAPAIRANAFSFVNTLSKAARIFAILTRTAGIALVAAIIVLLYKFFLEHLLREEYIVHIKTLDELASFFPSLSRTMYVIIIVLALCGVAVARVVLKELLRPDPRK